MTKALIEFTSKEEKSLFYVYHDGYPEGLGKTLLGYLGERFNQRDWFYKQILSDIKDDKIRNFQLSSESEEDFQGISYLYIVECDNKKVSCYNCYGPGGRSSKAEIVSPKNQERIPSPVYARPGDSFRYYKKDTFFNEVSRIIGDVQTELEQYIQFHPEDINETNINYEEMKEYAIHLANICSRVRELIEEERNSI